MLYFKTLLGPKYWSVNHNLNNTESTLLEDASIIISHIVVLEKNILNSLPIYFLFKFELLLGSQYWSGSHNLEPTVLDDACIGISQIVALKFLKRIFLNIFPIYFVNFEPLLVPK